MGGRVPTFSKHCSIIFLRLFWLISTLPFRPSKYYLLHSLLYVYLRNCVKNKKNKIKIKNICILNQEMLSLRHSSLSPPPAITMLTIHRQFTQETHLWSLSLAVFNQWDSHYKFYWAGPSPCIAQILALPNLCRFYLSTPQCFVSVA